MAFGQFAKSGDVAPMSEINMIPLVDVMLVLLVIFIVSAPLLTHAVKIELPKAASQPNDTRPENIQLGVKANGEVYWNGERIEAHALEQRMMAASKIEPQPEVHLRADRTAQYQKIAEVISAAARAGLVKIGFVTEPRDDR